MGNVDDLAGNKIIMVNSEPEIRNVDNMVCSMEFMSLLKEEKQTLQILGKSSYGFKAKMEFTDAFWRIQNKVRTMTIQIDFFLCTLRIYKGIIKPARKNLYDFSTRPKRVRIERLYKLTDEEFVKELYQTFFDREADDDGFRHNVKVLRDDKCSRLDMIDNFKSADEAAWTSVEIIEKDITGEKGSFLHNLSIYKNVIMPGYKKVYILFHPLRKKVRIDRLYKLNDEDFVKKLYRVFLNRKPDAEGYKYHLNLLQTNQCDRLTLINAFNNSVEGAQISVEIIGELIPQKEK